MAGSWTSCNFTRGRGRGLSPPISLPSRHSSSYLSSRLSFCTLLLPPLCLFGSWVLEKSLRPYLHLPTRTGLGASWDDSLSPPSAEPGAHASLQGNPPLSRPRGLRGAGFAGGLMAAPRARASRRLCFSTTLLLRSSPLILSSASSPSRLRRGRRHRSKRDDGRRARERSSRKC